jgi:predicted nucleotidyltransferase
MTAHPLVDVVLSRLLAQLQNLLGEQLVGLYLDGSLATGDFDAASDIDFVVVLHDEPSAPLFVQLQALHDDLASLDSPYKHDLEGSYLSKAALRRYDPALTRAANLKRGPTERLKWVELDESWLTHRFILRQRGIVLFGPPLASLIDPISPDDLRQQMQQVLAKYAQWTFDNQQHITTSGFQSYLVLTFCRICYTLSRGDVASKKVASDWAQQTLEQTWQPLIEQAWQDRQQPNRPTTATELAATLDFVRYVIDLSDISI